MNKKDNQRSRLTRMLLKNAYLQLMNDSQVSKITVKEICALAELNRSTFYLYYNEPNDILMELEDETISRVVSSINSIGSSPEDSHDAESYLLVFLRDIRLNDKLLKALLVKNSDPHFRRKLQDIALKMAESSFAIDLEKETKAKLYLFIVSGCIELLVDWVKSDYRIPEKELCKMLYALCEGCIKNICA